MSPVPVHDAAGPAPIFLQDVAVLGGLTGPSLDLVLGHLHRRRVPARQCVFSAGERAHELYIIESGEVELVTQAQRRSNSAHAVERGERVHWVCGRGGCFGTMSLLDIQPRAATARTRAPTTLLVLPYRELLTIQMADPQAFTLLIMNIAREISRRLRRAHELLSQAPPPERRWSARPRRPHPVTAARRSV